MEDIKHGYAGAKANRKNRKLNMAFLIMRWCESESQNEGRIEESEDERREGRGGTDDVKSERVVQKKEKKKIEPTETDLGY